MKCLNLPCEEVLASSLKNQPMLRLMSNLQVLTVTFVGNTIITYHIPVDDPESEVNKPATSKTLRSRPQSRICSNIRISIKLTYCSRKGQGSSEKYIKTQGPEGNFSP